MRYILSRGYKGGEFCRVCEFNPEEAMTGWLKALSPFLARIDDDPVTDMAWTHESGVVYQVRRCAKIEEQP